MVGQRPSGGFRGFRGPFPGNKAACKQAIRDGMIAASNKKPLLDNARTPAAPRPESK